MDKDLKPVPSDEIRCLPSLWAITAIEEEDGVELWFVPDQTRLICRMKLCGEAVAETGTAQSKKKMSKRNIYHVPVEIIDQVPESANGWTYYSDIKKQGILCT